MDLIEYATKDEPHTCALRYSTHHGINTRIVIVAPNREAMERMRQVAATAPDTLGAVAKELGVTSLSPLAADMLYATEARTTFRAGDALADAAHRGDVATVTALRELMANPVPSWDKARLKVWRKQFRDAAKH